MCRRPQRKNHVVGRNRLRIATEGHIAIGVGHKHRCSVGNVAANRVRPIAVCGRSPVNSSIKASPARWSNQKRIREPPAENVKTSRPSRASQQDECHVYGNSGCIREPASIERHGQASLDSSNAVISWRPKALRKSNRLREPSSTAIRHECITD